MKGNSATMTGAISSWVGTALAVGGLMNWPISTAGQQIPLSDHPAGTAVVAGVSLIIVGVFLFRNGMKDAYAKN